MNGHEFVEVPAGPACLGSGLHDPYASEAELPLREVFVSAFEIARHPTTRAQYARFIESNRRPHPGWWPELARTGRLPATEVSWRDAVDYCMWVGDESGVRVALPTEAEWEKAARGGDDRIWPWGNEFSPALCNSAEGRGSLVPVDSFERGASPYGCLHMSGGVWEWCEDFHHRDSHQWSPTVDPVVLRPSGQRVVKGGSAFCTKEIVRPACRDWTNQHNQGGGDDGFRVVIRPWRPAARFVVPRA